MNRALDAYAAGVNAFLASRRGALPPEFLLLRFTPEAWRPGRQPGLGQADGPAARRQLPRRIAARPDGPDDLGRADLAVLYPEYPKDAPTTLAELAPIYRRLALDRAL